MRPSSVVPSVWPVRDGAIVYATFDPFTPYRKTQYQRVEWAMRQWLMGGITLASHKDDSLVFSSTQQSFSVLSRRKKAPLEEARVVLRIERDIEHIMFDPGAAANHLHAEWLFSCLCAASKTMRQGNPKWFTFAVVGEKVWERLDFGIAECLANAGGLRFAQEYHAQYMMAGVLL